MDSPRSILVRALAQEELGLLGPLWNDTGSSYHPNGRDRLDKLTAQWRANASGFVGAFDGTRLIGSVLATDDGRRGWINRLAVHPNFRHSGLARRLLAAAEDVLKSRGLQIFTALIDDQNNASRALFESSGYDFMPEILYYSKRESPDV